MKREIRDVAASLLQGEGVALTGAGLGTESGVPAFRGKGGIWGEVNREIFRYRNFLQDPEARRGYWQMSQRFYARVREARPNPAHLALSELHRLGALSSLITQNTDGLHQKAGFPAERLIELHGTSHRVRCLSCGLRLERAEVFRRIEGGELPPYCRSCGGLLKVDAVLFGEGIPKGRLLAAEALAREAGVFLAIGTSLLVRPAAHLPLKAKRAGACLIILNRDPTPLDGWADLVLRGEVSLLLPKLEAAVREWVMGGEVSKGPFCLDIARERDH